jgi:hypothetical protein
MFRQIVVQLLLRHYLLVGSHLPAVDEATLPLLLALLLQTSFFVVFVVGRVVKEVGVVEVRDAHDGRGVDSVAIIVNLLPLVGSSRESFICRAVSHVVLNVSIKKHAA